MAYNTSTVKDLAELSGAKVALEKLSNFNNLRRIALETNNFRCLFE
jgi:hypothetical protein